MRRFKGVISPVVTPFDENGDVYELGFDNLFRFLSENGIDGVFCIGSYGSFPLMEMSQRKLAIKIAIEKSKKYNLKSIIHIGHADTKHTIELSKYAETLRPDALAMVIPYYYSGHAYDEKNILSHFQNVRNSVSGPLHFYNNPRTTKVSATPSLLKSLIEMGLDGMKDSGSDMDLFKEYADIAWSLNPDFDLMPGSGSVFLEGFDIGAEACVAGTSMAFPKLFHRMYRKYIEGDLNGAKSLQKIANKAREIQEKYNMRPAAAYDIVRMQGVDIGIPRSPWRELTNEEYNLTKNELLKINAFD
jgi:4-hydroxy-tetrahydrodipicolinate synthase